MTIKPYSESVEAVILYQGKILLTKRAKTVKLAPNCWNVPAGKIELGETPGCTAVRECKEETNLNVEFVRSLGKRRVESTTVDGQPVTRDVFTLLVKPTHNSIADFNLALREHSESIWINPEILLDASQYESLMPELRTLLIKVGD